METRVDYLQGAAVETIYFGGGTPSLLEPGELAAIIGRTRQLFAVSPDAEITLEANPDDMTDPGRIRAWRAAGFNRLSIGIQSLFDKDLRWMNRAHDAAQAAESIRLARAAGFDNISIDLIYGGPTLPDDRWEQNVRQAIAWEIPHLSCYALTVEPRTALDTMIRRNKRQEVSPADQARQLELLMEWTAAAGYEQYEISNFARPGHRSRHNSAYWQGIPYLGLGPSAHSFNGSSRQWNIADNAGYIAALSEGTAGAAGSAGTTETSPMAEKELLTPVQQLNEYIMVSLRTMEGCDLQRIAHQFGQAAAQEITKKIKTYIFEEKAVMSADRIFLTPRGKLWTDRISADLFFD